MATSDEKAGESTQSPEFDRWGATYEDVLAATLGASGSPAYYHRVKALRIARTLGTKFSGRLLDFGCGIGGLLRHLVVELPLAEIVGFDPSAESVMQAATIPGLGAVVSDESRLHSASFDAVVISNVLHHVNIADRPNIAWRIRALLRDGGRIMVIEHNPFNPMTRWWVVARCPFDEGVVLLRPRQVRKLLQRARFRDIKQEYMTFVPEPLSWALPVEHCLGWIPMGAQTWTTGTR